MANRQPHTFITHFAATSKKTTHTTTRTSVGLGGLIADHGQLINGSESLEERLQRLLVHVFGDLRSSEISKAAQTKRNSNGTRAVSASRASTEQRSSPEAHTCPTKSL
jgi:hypothetical protein